MSAPPSISLHARRAPTRWRWAIRLVALAIFAVIIYRCFGPQPISPASALPKYTIVPPFALTERNGRTITNIDLFGKIWVADFVYTTCPGPCPLVTANMAKVQQAVANDPQVQLVTFTVDPQDDTPAVLAAYADKFGASPSRWWFLTGAEKPLYDLIQHGFYQVVQDNHGQALQPGEFVVTHSTKMVLIDADGNVRGFYDGVGPDGRASLLAGIKTLEKEEKP
jgi:protein SCO1/2